MGFGSYDESEQQDEFEDMDDDDAEGIQTSENDHDGEVNFEFTASNDELLDRLEDIKDT